MTVSPRWHRAVLPSRYRALLAKLEAGGKVADVGCGHGASTVAMAEQNPRSRFQGFDYHDASIATSRERGAEAGVADRCAFEVTDAQSYPGTYDLICSSATACTTWETRSAWRATPASTGPMATFVVKALEEADGCGPAIPGTGEMVEVGSVCIDKYESSLWTQPDGGEQITGPIPCSGNGQDCDNIYARSVAGVEPRGLITWFQAQAALANSGKRLPTNAEWQMAVLGTPDPGDSPGSEECNTSASGPEVTGERANCVSRWGIHDMVGNLWEWVADWDEQAAGCDNWSSTFGDDRTCIGRGDGDGTNRFPGALIRGGDFLIGSNAGPFAVNGVNRPSISFSHFGFRGAR